MLANGRWGCDCHGSRRRTLTSVLQIGSSWSVYYYTLGGTLSIPSINPHLNMYHKLMNRTADRRDSVTFVSNILPIQMILQTLLMLIIPKVTGKALQVYSSHKTSSLPHVLFPRNVEDVHKAPGGHEFILPPNFKPLAPYDRAPMPLSPRTWQELRIDEYLRYYPRGLEINLAEFAAQHDALNFQCGLNQFCSSGQLGYPIFGRAWWVLAAVEQFTYYHNSLYTAIAFAASQAKAIGAELVNDLYRQDAEKKFRLFQSIGMILTCALAVVATVTAAVFMLVPGLQAFGVMAAAGAVVTVAQVTMFMKAREAELEAGDQDTFTKWSHYEGLISEWQRKSQTKIGERFKAMVESPVSTHHGIFGALLRGNFCRNTQPQDTNDLERKMTRILLIRMVGQILRALKGFVVIGEGCVQTGIDGAFSIEDGWLSYCDKRGGVMMNVIYDDDGKSGNQFYNARLLVEKYKITPKYIALQAVECSKKNKGPDYDPYADGIHDEMTVKSHCLINLPVCYNLDPEVHESLKDHTTPEACRSAGHMIL